MKVHTIVNMTFMVMSNIVQSDVGDYTITLENENAKHIKTVKVIVIGKLEII